MVSKESYSKGFYNPNFFTLYIEGEFNIDFKKMNSKELGTFAHEYLHFLQNITTLYGLRQGIFYFQFLYELKKYILNSSSFTVPLSLNFLSKRIKNGKKIFNLMEGTSWSKHLIYESYNIEITQNQSLNKSHSIVEILFFNKTHQIQRISFGSLCVKESMARIFQLEFDELAKANNIPYDTANLIIKKLNPKLSKDKNKILTYLLISLNHNNPGLAFYKLILNADDDSTLNSSEIYSKHINSYTVNRDDGSKLPFQEFFKATLIDFKKLLDSQTAGNINQFTKIIENTELLYSNGNNPILQIFNDREIVGLEKLRILVDQFGIPSIRSKDGFLTFPKDIENQEPAIEFVDFMVQRTVIERLLESNDYPKICSMLPICIEANETVDDFCYEYQWKRSLPCPFKVVSDNWELNVKIIED